MPPDDDRYVPDPKGPLAKGLPPGYLRHYWHLRRRLVESPLAPTSPIQRFLLWYGLSTLFQTVGFFAVTAQDGEAFGSISQAAVHVLGPWPVFLVPALLLPALAFVVVVPPPGVPLRRAALFAAATAAGALLLNGVLLLIFTGVGDLSRFIRAGR